MNIIIIGAGISGLAAANYLRDKSFDVTLLEARSRAGGRIATDNTWEFPLAKGAHWIHGVDNNPIMTLAKKYNSPLGAIKKVDPLNYTSSGRSLPNQQVTQWNAEFDEWLIKAKQFALNEKMDCSLAAALSHFIPSYPSDEFINTLLSKKIKFFENYIGDNYENISARYWDIGESFTGEHYIIIDSYTSIINGLAESLDIQFNTIVSQINKETDHIEIISNQGIHKADLVIVTLPLGVLKSKSVLVSSKIYKLIILRISSGKDFLEQTSFSNAN